MKQTYKPGSKTKFSTWVFIEPISEQKPSRLIAQKSRIDNLALSLEGIDIIKLNDDWWLLAIGGMEWQKYHGLRIKNANRYIVC